MKQFSPNGRLLPDWINGFKEWTQKHPTLDTFREWVATSVIAAALSRKVWIISARRPIFPNLFINPNGPPGCGKDVAIEAGEELAVKSGVINMAPVSLSAKGFVDDFANEGNIETILMPQQNRPHPVEVRITSMYSALGELGTVLPEYSSSFLSILNELYNNKRVFRDRIRGRSEDTVIVNPCINLCWGTQPNFMASTFKEEAWGMGFFSRVIIAFDSGFPSFELFEEGYGENDDDYGVYQADNDLHGEHVVDLSLLKGKLIHDLRRISKLTGRFSVPSKVLHEIDAWKNHGQFQDAPTHSKLEHYNTRRLLHMMKLTQVMCASRTDDMIISIEDWRRALDMLQRTEARIPSLFASMTSSRGEKSNMEEAQHLVAEYQRTHGGRSLPEHRLRRFLIGRVPGYMMNTIIEELIKTRMLTAIDGIGGERIFKVTKANRATS